MSCSKCPTIPCSCRKIYISSKDRTKELKCNSCKKTTVARYSYRKKKNCCDNIAFGLITVKGEYIRQRNNWEENTVELDKNVTNKNISSVQHLGPGRFKINFKNGVFNDNPDNRYPVIHVTPCESGILTEVVDIDENNNEIILSEIFPTEQAVVLCTYVDNLSAIVTTGRILSGIIQEEEPPVQTIPIVGPPIVTDDVSFYFTAFQANSLF